MTGDEPLLLCEPFAITDAFATELAYVEQLGSCVRLVFAARKRSACGGVERNVAACIVLPAEVLADVGLALTRACVTEADLVDNVHEVIDWH